MSSTHYLPLYLLFLGITVIGLIACRVGWWQLGNIFEISDLDGGPWLVTKSKCAFLYTSYYVGKYPTSSLVE